MKNTLLTVIALAAVLSLSSCGDEPEHKSKSKIKEKSEITTEAPTLPIDNDKYTMVDAFEKSYLEVYGTYPDDFTAFFCTADSDYNKKIDYDCMIKVADAEKIIIEVKADYSKYENDLKEMGYKFESDTKTYEINLDDMKNTPYYDYSTRLLKTDQLTDENINAIMEHCNRITSSENIEKIYALIPKTSVFLENYKFTDKFETGVRSNGYKAKMLQKVPSNQVFVINRTFSIMTDEWSEEINTFGVELEDDEIVRCEIPSKAGILDENYTLSDDDTIEERFEKILESYKEQGYDFEVKEIQIPRETT